MAMTPEVRRTILAYQQLVADRTNRIVSYANRAWNSLSSYRDADMARITNAIIPVVLGAQRQQALMTDTYLAAVATASGYDERPRGVRVEDVTGEAIRGVEMSVVYHRPAVAVWTALSDGKSVAEAAAEGRNRLVNLLKTDLQLTKTHTAARRQRGDDRVVGYRRILAGGENCSLCALASTQRYHVGDLMPIHSNCNCDIGEIRGQEDPGQVINPDLLSSLKEQATDKVSVREHGEIGPILTWASQHFTGPNDIPAAA